MTINLYNVQSLPTNYFHCQQNTAIVQYLTILGFMKMVTGCRNICSALCFNVNKLANGREMKLNLKLFINCIKMKNIHSEWYYWKTGNFKYIFRMHLNPTVFEGIVNKVLPFSAPLHLICYSPTQDSFHQRLLFSLNVENNTKILKLLVSTSKQRHS